MDEEGEQMRIVFAGTPAAAVPSLRALLASRHDVVAVVTRPDAPAGRGRRTVPSPVAALAGDAGLELLTPATTRDPAFVARLREIAPDAAAVVAYGAILRQDVLDVPEHGWVNLHFSLLPAWRGAAPVQAAIRAGDAMTGASTFRLEAGLDTGPVYAVVTDTVAPRDTAGSLLDRLAVSGAQLLVTTLDGIEDGSLVPVAQPVDGVSSAPKITVADAQVHWDRPTVAVDRLIRSVTPAPGAWTTSPWGRLGLGPVEPTDEAGLRPGELAAGRREVLVGTAGAAVRLSTVQPVGKRPLPAADWARGVRPPAGAALGEPASPDRTHGTTVPGVDDRTARSAAPGGPAAHGVPRADGARR